MMKKTGAALQGAEFQIRYLGGHFRHRRHRHWHLHHFGNGSIILTRLKAGTYIVEETKASPFYSIDTPPQTVLLSGKDQDVVTLRFSNQPYGSSSSRSWRMMPVKRRWRVLPSSSLTIRVRSSAPLTVSSPRTSLVLSSFLRLPAGTDHRGKGNSSPGGVRIGRHTPDYYSTGG